MKNKILTIISIVIFTICALSINVFSVITSSTFKMSTSKETYNVGEEVTLTLRLDSLTADRGIISYGAVLEYDKSALKYVSHSGIGNWTSPYFNEENGKLIADRNSDFSPLDGEDLCTIKFIAQKEVDNTTFKLSNIELSNGSNAPGKSNDVEISISIKNPSSSDPSEDKEPETNPDDNEPETKPGDNDNKPDDNNKPDNNDNNNDNNNNSSNNNNNNNNIPTGNNNGNNNNSKPNNSTTGTSNSASDSMATTRIPNLGANTYLTASIVVIMLFIIIMIYKTNLLNKKIKKQVNYIIADEIVKDVKDNDK